MLNDPVLFADVDEKRFDLFFHQLHLFVLSCVCLLQLDNLFHEFLLVDVDDGNLRIRVVTAHYRLVWHPLGVTVVTVDGYGRLSVSVYVVIVLIGLRLLAGISRTARRSRIGACERRKARRLIIRRFDSTIALTAHKERQKEL